MIKPYHIRKYKNLKLEDEIIIKDSQNKIILKMEPLKEIFIEQKKVIPFKCEFNKSIKQTIKIDEQIYEGYTVPNNFSAYYFESEKIIIFNSSKTLTNEFLKLLKEKEEIEFEKVTFDLKKILDSGTTVSKGMHFKYADANVRSKSFHGTNVEKNLEAESALNNDKVTYITISMDIAANGQISQKTINISKNSSISVVSKLETEESYLELVFNTYLKIKDLLWYNKVIFQCFNDGVFIARMDKHNFIRNFYPQFINWII